MKYKVQLEQHVIHTGRGEEKPGYKKLILNSNIGLEHLERLDYLIMYIIYNNYYNINIVYCIFTYMYYFFKLMIL